MDSKVSSVVLITGANRGIGLALSQHYFSKGLHVIAVCRKASEELQSMGVEIIYSIDVSKAEDVQHLKDRLDGRHIDILINNAGILRSHTFNNLDYQAVLEQFEVNAMGPLRVVDALRDNVSSGSKIVMVTSRMGSIEDNTSGGQYGYRMSKSALNAATKSLAIDLKPKGIAVALLHPGYVQTDMVNNGGEITAEVSAERLIQRIKELSLDNTGSFWHSNGEILPW
jgi:NAD(P)-dependent dehydrogenase (short-subunit alcohol dehydrogenase family)